MWATESILFEHPWGGQRAPEPQGQEDHPVGRCRGLWAGRAHQRKLKKQNRPPVSKAVRGTEEGMKWGCSASWEDCWLPRHPGHENWNGLERQFTLLRVIAATSLVLQAVVLFVTWTWIVKPTCEKLSCSSAPWDTRSLVSEWCRASAPCPVWSSPRRSPHLVQVQSFGGVVEILLFRTEIWFSRKCFYHSCARTFLGVERWSVQKWPLMSNKWMTSFHPSYSQQIWSFCLLRYLHGHKHLNLQQAKQP